MVHQQDPRYVDMFVKEICFGKENTAQTPAADDTSNDNSEPLEQEQISRSHVPRCLFLSRDRADITYTVNELCQRMTNPTQRSLVRVRYFEGDRQWDKSSVTIRIAQK